MATPADTKSARPDDDPSGGLEEEGFRNVEDFARIGRRARGLRARRDRSALDVAESGTAGARRIDAEVDAAGTADVRRALLVARADLVAVRRLDEQAGGREEAQREHQDEDRATHRGSVPEPAGRPREPDVARCARRLRYGWR